VDYFRTVFKYVTLDMEIIRIKNFILFHFKQFKQIERSLVYQLKLASFSKIILTYVVSHEYSQSRSCRRRGLLSTLSLTVQTVTLYSLPGVNPTNETLVSMSSTIRSFVVLFSSLILNR